MARIESDLNEDNFHNRFEQLLEPVRKAIQQQLAQPQAQNPISQDEWDHMIRNHDEVVAKISQARASAKPKPDRTIDIS